MAIMIDPHELATWLGGHEPPTLLDVRWHLRRSGREDFHAGHIPGSQWVNLEQDLAGPPGTEGRHPLPAAAVFATAMRRYGVRAERRVVVVDDGSLLAAGRLWWLLTDSGHDQVYVLDGGFPAWRAEGYGAESGDSPAASPGTFTAQPGHRAQYDTAEIARGSHRLWDVRSIERFRGEREPMDPVAGHIPGAQHLGDAELFVEGRLQPVSRLREVFAAVRTGDVVYCGSGVTAARTVLALEIAGIADVALYPGSWSAWIADPGRPVVTGG